MADKKDKTKEPKAGGGTKGPRETAKPAAAEQKAQARKEAPPAEGKKPAAAPGPQMPAVPPRLKEKYDRDVVPALMKEFSYKNRMQAPRIVKVVLNVGMGEAITNAKALDHAVNEIATIT